MNTSHPSASLLKLLQLLSFFLFASTPLSAQLHLGTKLPELTGSFGPTDTVELIVYYSNAVDIETVDTADLVIEGISGDAIGKTIPVVEFRTVFDDYFLRWNAVYTIGPLDPEGNGEYRVSIVEGQVLSQFGNPPDSVPAGEIGVLNQNATIEVNLAVTAVNDEAYAASRAYPLFQIINVLANDSVDPPESKDLATIEFVSPPGQAGAETRIHAHGKVVEYKPAADFLGEDTFTYTVNSTNTETNTATVTVFVNTTTGGLPDPGTTATARQMRSRWLETEQGRFLLSLLQAFLPEFDFHTLDQSSGLEANDQDHQKPSNHSNGIREGGTPETEAAVIKMFQDFQPGFSALLAGQGDTEVISQQMVDDVKAVMDLVLSVATPQLKEVIEEQAAQYNNLDDFVGKNFNEWAEMLELNLESGSIEGLNPSFTGQSFSISTFEVPHLNFKLWKSTSLEPESWVEIEDAEVTIEGIHTTLTDPNPVSERAFYRLSNELEQSP